MDLNNDWYNPGHKMKLFKLPEFKSNIFELNQVDNYNDIKFYWHEIYIDSENIVLKYDVTNLKNESLIIDYATIESENMLSISTAYDCQMRPTIVKTISFSYLPFPNEVIFSIFRLKILEENTVTLFSNSDEPFLYTQPKLPKKILTKEEKKFGKDYLIKLIKFLDETEKKFIPWNKSIVLNISFPVHVAFC